MSGKRKTGSNPDRTAHQVRVVNHFPSYLFIFLFICFSAFAAGSAYVLVKKDNQIEKFRRIELELQNDIKQRDFMIQQHKQHIEQLERRVEIMDAIKSLSYADIPENKLKKIAKEVDLASEKYGHDPILLVALMSAESSFDDQAQSHVGAQGLMQLMPITAEHLNNQIRQEPRLIGSTHDDVTAVNRYDIDGNIQLGALYLAQMIVRYEDLDKALYAYNLGPNMLDERLKSGGPVPEQYRLKIMQRYQNLKHLAQLKDKPLPAILSDDHLLALISTHQDLSNQLLDNTIEN